MRSDLIFLRKQTHFINGIAELKMILEKTPDKI